jgi:predicted CopG family antitoxin
MKKVTVCLPDSVYRKLKKLASESGLSYARVVEGLIEKDHRWGKESIPDFHENSVESKSIKIKNEEVAWTRTAVEFALTSLIVTHSSLIYLAEKLDKDGGYGKHRKSIEKEIEKYLTVLGYQSSTTAEKE